MHAENVTALFAALPENATDKEAVAWMDRVRRILTRWEELPAEQTQAMTPELVEQAIGELNEMERLIYPDTNAARQV